MLRIAAMDLHVMSIRQEHAVHKELEEAIAMAAVIKKNLDTAGFTSSSEAIALVRDTMEVRIMVSELGIFDM